MPNKMGSRDLGRTQFQKYYTLVLCTKKSERSSFTGFGNNQAYAMGNGLPLLALLHLVSLPVSTALRIVNRCLSGFPCQWRYTGINVNLLTF